MALASGADLAGCGLAAHLGVPRAALEADPCVARGAIERHALAEPGGVRKRGVIILLASLSHRGFFTKSMSTTRKQKPGLDTKRRDRLSSTICAKNQALNENIDKVIRILRQFFLINLFVSKSGFASEWLM
jgi:hypothetical protein